MGFKFSKASLAKLQGVHPDLQRVVLRAIQITKIDFSVIEGLRTKDRQKELVASGASQTMNSRHITGHAVDLAPFVGEIKWDWPLYHIMAQALKQAAIAENVPIIWGGCWESLNTMGDTVKAVQAYSDRCKAAGKRAFLDGPHFELDRKVYP